MGSAGTEGSEQIGIEEAGHWLYRQQVRLFRTTRSSTLHVVHTGSTCTYILVLVCSSAAHACQAALHV